MRPSNKPFLALTAKDLASPDVITLPRRCPCGPLLVCCLVPASRGAGGRSRRSVCRGLLRNRLPARPTPRRSLPGRRRGGRLRLRLGNLETEELPENASPGT
jgi:hypothetical protein